MWLGRHTRERERWCFVKSPLLSLSLSLFVLFLKELSGLGGANTVLFQYIFSFSFFLSLKELSGLGGADTVLFQYLVCAKRGEWEEQDEALVSRFRV